MEISEIKETLNEVFRDVFDDDSIHIHENMTSADVAAWDSLNYVTLIVGIEKKMKIKFTTKEATSLQNVGQLIDLIHKKLN